MNVKKQQILTSAHTLFTTKGYMSTSLQDILDNAKVSKGTFYHYFSSKSDCLIEIIKSIISEIQQKRRAIAQSRAADDPSVLAEQLAIRIEMNRMRNLILLYESIFHAQEPELKRFAQSNFMEEVNWLAKRIVDLYGHEIEPYALDNAVILNGSIQHLSQVWKLNTTEELPTKELASYLITRLTDSIESQAAHQIAFLKSGTLPGLAKEELLPPDEISAKLRQAAASAQDDVRELLVFLAEELDSEAPRFTLMQSALTSLSKHPEVTRLSFLLEQMWRTINASKNR